MSDKMEVKARKLWNRCNASMTTMGDYHPLDLIQIALTEAIAEERERCSKKSFEWFGETTLDKIVIEGDTEGERIANVIRWTVHSIAAAIREDPLEK